MLRLARRSVPTIAGIALLCALAALGVYRYAFAGTVDVWVVRSATDPISYSVPVPPNDFRTVTVSSSYLAVSAVDSRTAFAVGWYSNTDAPTVIPLWGRTTDGTSWSLPTSMTAYTGRLRAADALSATNAWAVGDGGLVLQWNGSTWTRRAVGVTTAQLNGVAFTDASRGWAVGSGGAIIQTVDGGANWTTQSAVGLITDLYAVSAASPNYAIAVGALGKAAKWNGTTWSTMGMGTGTAEDLLSVDLFDSSHGLAVGRAGTFLRWQGVTWMTPTSKELLPGYSNAVRAVTMADGASGLAVGDYGMVWRTTDGGVNWWVDQVPAYSGGTVDIDRSGADTAPDADTRVWITGDTPSVSGQAVARVCEGTLYYADTTPPSTTIAPSGTGWFNTSQAVSFSATDDRSGVAETWHRVNGGVATTTPTFTAPHGRTSVSYWSVDVAGNIEAAHDTTISVDTQGPTGVSSSASGVWRRTAETVSVDATDALSGLQSKYYSRNGGSDVIYPETGFVEAAEGTTTIGCAAVDNAGNRTAGAVRYVLIDYGTPETTATGVPSGWASADVTVTLSATDALSRVASIKYARNGGPEQTYGSGIPVTTEGTTTLTFAGIDNAGNREATKTVTVRIDKAKPVTIPGGAPSGWASADVTVTLSATDALSRVASIQYARNGGPEQTYGSGIPVTTEGTTTLTFAGIDNAGNREATKTVTVRIDKTKPVTTTGAIAQMYWGDASIDLAATDVLSGVPILGTAWRVGTGAEASGTLATITSTTGAQTLYFHSHDNAGNEEAEVTRTVVVMPVDSLPPASMDATAGSPKPMISLTWTDASNNEEGFELQRSTDGVNWSRVGLASRDATSFADETAKDWFAAYRYRVRSYTPVTFGSPDTATWTLAPASVRLADAPPFTLAWLRGSKYLGDSVTPWIASAEVTVALEADIPDAAVWFSLDSGPAEVCTAPITIARSGIHELIYGATAASHDPETTRTLTVRIDTTAPVTTANVGLTASQPLLVLTPADAQSGPGTTWYSFDGGAETTYSPPVAVPWGVHIVTWHSHDAAGNAELPRSGTIIGGPQASVSTPKGSSSTRARRTLTFSGTLTRTTNHKRLTLLAYKFNGVSWVLIRSTTVTTHTPSRRGKTTYRGSIRFTSKGSWKVVARYAGDTRYVQSFSAPKYVRVR